MRIGLTVARPSTQLVEQEIIELRPLPGNRKNKQIVLTASGKALVAEIISPLIEAERNSFLKLGEEDGEEFLRLTKSHLELFHREIEQILK